MKSVPGVTHDFIEEFDEISSLLLKQSFSPFKAKERYSNERIVTCGKRQY